MIRLLAAILSALVGQPEDLLANSRTRALRELLERPDDSAPVAGTMEATDAR